jgi:hypothetical protein
VLFGGGAGNRNPGLANLFQLSHQLQILFNSYQKYSQANTHIPPKKPRLHLNIGMTSTKTISLQCKGCDIRFDKSLKEYKRRNKLGVSTFYCSLSCAGKNTKNLDAWKIDKNGTPFNIGRKKYTPDIEPFVEYVRRARMRKQHNCDLDIYYLKDIWDQQEGRCALSGIPLQHGSNGDINTKASLDRKNASLGYIRGNVQFLSCALNYAKSTKDDDSIGRLIALIVKHHS